MPDAERPADATSAERMTGSNPELLKAAAGVVPKPLRTSMVTAKAAARLPRQSLGQTRNDLLEAAVRIVNEYVADGPRASDPPVDLLPFVRLEEVLDGATALARDRLVKVGGFQPEERVAPLTAGAFYKAFATNPSDFRESGRGIVLTHFHRLVTQHMVENPILTTANTYIELGRQLLEQGYGWSEVVRHGVTAEYTRWQQTPALVLMSALAFHAKDPDTAAWAEQVDDHQIAEVARIYEVLLPVFGRKMRRGLQIIHMATAVSDLIGGMVLNSRFSADVREEILTLDADGTGEKDWSLCALSAWSIYDRFTELKS